MGALRQPGRAPPARLGPARDTLGCRLPLPGRRTHRTAVTHNRVATPAPSRGARLGPQQPCEAHPWRLCPLLAVRQRRSPTAK